MARARHARSRRCPAGPAAWLRRAGCAYSFHFWCFFTCGVSAQCVVVTGRSAAVSCLTLSLVCNLSSLNSHPLDARLLCTPPTHSTPRLSRLMYADRGRAGRIFDRRAYSRIGGTDGDMARHTAPVKTNLSRGTVETRSSFFSARRLVKRPDRSPAASETVEAAASLPCGRS